MKSIRELHDGAMDLATLADVARSTGNLEESQRLVLKAFHQEERASEQLVETGIGEPSRGVFLRSAASLAQEAGEIVKARAIAEIALDGDPDEDTRNDLEQIILEVKRLESIATQLDEVLSELIGSLPERYRDQLVFVYKLEIFGFGSGTKQEVGNASLTSRARLALNKLLEQRLEGLLSEQVRIEDAAKNGERLINVLKTIKGSPIGGVGE